MPAISLSESPYHKKKLHHGSPPCFHRMFPLESRILANRPDFLEAQESPASPLCCPGSPKKQHGPPGNQQKKQRKETTGDVWVFMGLAGCVFNVGICNEHHINNGGTRQNLH